METTSGKVTPGVNRSLIDPIFILFLSPKAFSISLYKIYAQSLKA